jgi:hypothetical protein
MTADLAFERQHERRVGVDVDSRDMVHLEGDDELHAQFPERRQGDGRVS